MNLLILSMLVASPEEALQRFKATQFEAVTRVAEAPEAILRALRAELKDEPISDPGGPWSSGCMSGDLLPRRQLVLAGRSPSLWFFWYHHSMGRGVTERVLTFSTDSHGLASSAGAWSLQINDERAPTTLDDLKQALAFSRSSSLDSAQALTRFRDAHFTEVTSVDELPGVVRAQLLEGEQMQLADPGARWQATDVIPRGRRLPNRRLKLAGHADELWFVWYEAGGFSHSEILLTLVNRGSLAFREGAWTIGMIRTVGMLQKAQFTPDAMR